MTAAKAQRVAFEHTYREGVIGEAVEAYGEAEELAPALTEVGVQQYTVYRLGRRCFTYLEHVDESIENDLRQLRERPAMSRLQSELSPLRVSSPEADASPRMDSVFFMA